MLEKAKEIIAKIERNDYLTAAEAVFVSEMKDVIEYIEGEFGAL